LARHDPHELSLGGASEGVVAAPRDADVAPATVPGYHRFAMTAATARFPISFDRAYGALSTALFMPPSASYVEIDGDEVAVRMGWGFRARFARSAVRSISPCRSAPLSRGVHGWRGRWLVNGSGRGIVTIDLSPPQRGYVVGFPVRLRQLMVSMEDPDGLAAALGGQRIGST
jgi:hypothetical protein